MDGSIEYYAYAGYGFAWYNDERYFIRKSLASNFNRPAYYLKAVCWFDTQGFVRNVKQGKSYDIYII
jgi:hypothetical protein